MISSVGRDSVGRDSVGRDSVGRGLVISSVGGDSGTISGSESEESIYSTYSRPREAILIDKMMKTMIKMDENDCRNEVEEGRLIYVNQNWSIKLFDPISIYVQSM